MKVCDVTILVSPSDLPLVLSSVVLEVITVFRLVKNYAIFYGPWSFITLFPRVYR